MPDKSISSQRGTIAISFWNLWFSETIVYYLNSYSIKKNQHFLDIFHSDVIICIGTYFNEGSGDWYDNELVKNSRTNAQGTTQPLIMLYNIMNACKSNTFIRAYIQQQTDEKTHNDKSWTGMHVYLGLGT